MTLKIKECFKSPLEDNLTIDDLYKYFTREIELQDLYLFGNSVNFFAGLHVENFGMYPEAFHHITTKKDKTTGIRIPEERRFYINHIVPMIRNVSECNTCNNIECSKIKVWTKPVDNRTKRTKLLYIGDGYNYMIILENDHKRKNNLNVVTSYLGNESWFLKKNLEEYDKYKK